MSMHSATPSAFFLYRDSPLRRAAVRAPVGDPSRYSLYGLDELGEQGFRVRHNLESVSTPGRSDRVLGAVLDRAVRLGGGYSGDFASVLAAWAELSRTDVVFSTVDTVGIPLALLGLGGRRRPPVVYAAIGLPERIAQLRTGLARRHFRDAYRRLRAIVTYAVSEAEELAAWLGPTAPPVRFVPFGVDTESFRPGEPAEPAHDVVSIGSDPRRDFPLLVDAARRLPERSFRIVASADNARALSDLPANVTLEIDVPFARIRECLLDARLVALPVRENTYSGATTTLLQAMACGRPVVVTRTAAIARGYHLADGENCRLVSPGDRGELCDAIDAVLGDESWAASLGARARETVVEHHTWRHYTDAVRDELLAAAARTTVAA